MVARVPVDAATPVVVVRPELEPTDRMRRRAPRSPERMREVWFLAATAALAIGVPAGTALWLRVRTDALAARLGETGGVPARIGRVEADLTGTVRLTDVALGEIVTADAIEASVGMGSLLGGHPRAEEIRIEAPRIALTVDASGDSDLARLAQKLVGRRSWSGAPGSPSAGSSHGLRRIVVAGGSLRARIAGVGEIAANEVELVPDADGVRIVTGPLRVVGDRARAGHVELDFERAAGEMSLETMRFGRVLAVGGTGYFAVAGRRQRVELREVAAGRRSATGALELRAAVEDHGKLRPIELDLDRFGAGFVATLRGDHVPLAPLAAFAPRGIVLANAHGSGTIVVGGTPVSSNETRILLDSHSPFSALRSETNRSEMGTANGERRTENGEQRSSGSGGPNGASSAFVLSVHGSIDGLVVDHPTIAPTPVPFTGAIRGELAVTNETISVDAKLKTGSIELGANGWLRRGPLRAASVQLTLAPAPCEQLLGDLPEPLRAPLDGLALRGTLGGQVRLGIDLDAPSGAGVLLTRTLDGSCEATAEPPAADVTQLAVASEQQLADGSRVRVGEGEPGFTPLGDLPEHVYGAFVSAEDGQFFSHHGFDLEQISRSLEIDLRERRFARGGSTISQQLVKNAFLSQRRSLDRKLAEAVLAWRLEARLGKRTILERYLAIIELGPRVFGITAAARHWFDRAPEKLSIRQAAFLAALTSQPTSMTRRVRKEGGLDPESAERVDVVLRAMRRDGVISKDELSAARDTPINFAATALEPER